MKITTKLIIGMGLLLSAAIAAVVKYPEQLIPKEYFDQIETRAPAISLHAPSVAGRDNLVNFRVRDDNSGLRGVRVKLNGQEIFKKDYDKVPEASEEIQLKYQTIRKYTELVLSVEAYDGSIWQNRANQDLTIPTDYIPPEVEVLSTEHNGTLGGALFMTMRIKGDSAEEELAKFVQVHDYEFPIFPVARGFERYLKEYQAKYPTLRYPADEIYYALVPLPFALVDQFGEKEYNKKLAISVVAKDAAGNESQSMVYNRVNKRVLKRSDLALSQEFFDKSIAKLYDKYEDFAHDNESSEGIKARLSEPQRELDKFVRINEDFRQGLEQVIIEICSKGYSKAVDGLNDAPQRWAELRKIAKPLAAKPTSTFGEARSYFLRGGDGKVLSQSKHLGIDLAHVRNSPVNAALDGTVVYAGDFGIYGKVVIIYHAGGMITLYGHLERVTVNSGDYLKKGELLGNSGETGLAGGDHLHFEVRIHGHAVSPFEWLDGNWIKTRIHRALREALLPLSASQ